MEAHPSDEELRMASFLNLDVNLPDTWPRDVLRRLIDLEVRDGRDALNREIRMLTSPTP
jgi:hypothetical protein